MTAPAEPADSFGAALADGDPHVWRALLDTHLADDRGRCRLCRLSCGPAQVWPCGLWCAANEARRLATR